MQDIDITNLTIKTVKRLPIITDLRLLRTRCEKLDDVQGTIDALNTSLMADGTMTYKGVGLAANQIGLFDRVCIIRANGKRLDLVNPRIIDNGPNLIAAAESCMSLPGIRCLVRRWANVTVATDNYDDPIIIDDQFLARVVQHEMDHLNGYIITDHTQESRKIGRNDPCVCGSGKKFKKCCGSNI